ncbi:MAG TPA: hypothetical protein DD738_13110 [Ruminiclostridium sp.]|jgi:DNA-binding LytR/AlgR family response regulator|nr:hypothetical protein [Ruminiclostridium sp.]
MDIAICDDEKVYLDLLSSYIKNCMAVHGDSLGEIMVDTYSSGKLLLDEFHQGKRYDLIFLDIRMKDLNGYDTAKHLRDMGSNSMIIFITSMADYIFSSFEYKPFWFLIKPISEEKFTHVFLKAFSEIKSIKKGNYSFYTRECGLVNIEINKILYLESSLRKIVLYTFNSQFIYYASMADEEAKLSRYDFIRIHKGYLVNMLYIQRINKSNVVLKNGAVLPLSEHRFKEVFDQFTSYLARC